MTGTTAGRVTIATARMLSLLACIAVAALLVAAGAQADPATTCVKATKVKPPKPAKPHYTGGWNDKACTAVEGKHEGKYEKLAAFSESEEAQLKALLKYVSVQPSGVDAKPTVQFSGANVQIVNGEGSTKTANGEGNLVVGYDEKPGAQTGSHNLILGEEQTFTSFGGILGGKENTISAPFASATGGSKNTASGENASVSGGNGNTASANGASVTGGSTNIASGPVASVSGGNENSSTGSWSWVGGGERNLAGGPGFSEYLTSVFGGYKNKATGHHSSIAGGKEKEAKNEFEAVL